MYYTQYTHREMHTYKQNYSDITKGWVHDIWHNVDGCGGYYAKWNKSDWERQIPYHSTHK